MFYIYGFGTVLSITIFSINVLLLSLTIMYTYGVCLWKQICANVYIFSYLNKLHIFNNILTYYTFIHNSAAGKMCAKALLRNLYIISSKWFKLIFFQTYGAKNYKLLGVLLQRSEFIYDSLEWVHLYNVNPCDKWYLLSCVDTIMGLA